MPTAKRRQADNANAVRLDRVEATLATLVEQQTQTAAGLAKLADLLASVERRLPPVKVTKVDLDASEVRVASMKSQIDFSDTRLATLRTRVAETKQEFDKPNIDRDALHKKVESLRNSIAEEEARREDLLTAYQTAKAAHKALVRENGARGEKNRAEAEAGLQRCIDAQKATEEANAAQQRARDTAKRNAKTYEAGNAKIASTLMAASIADQADTAAMHAEAALQNRTMVKAMRKQAALDAAETPAAPEALEERIRTAAEEAYDAKIARKMAARAQRSGGQLGTGHASPWTA